MTRTAGLGPRPPPGGRPVPAWVALAAVTSCACPRPVDVTIPVPPDPGAEDAAPSVEDVTPPPALPEGYLFVPQIGHAAPAWATALADGRIASVDSDGLLLVRSADLRDVLIAAHLGIAGATAVDFAAGGEGARIAVGTAAGGVHLCRLSPPNAPPGRPAECVPVGAPLPRAVSAIASMRDGDGATAMAIGSVSGGVRVRGPDGGDRWASGRDHSDRIAALAVSPDGRRLAAAGADGVVSVWSPSERDPGRPEKLVHDSPVTAVAFSPDGRVATGAANRTLRIWSGTPLVAEARFAGFSEGVSHVVFVDGGRRLAAAAGPDAIRFFRIPGPDGGDVVEEPPGPAPAAGNGRLRGLVPAPGGGLVEGGADGSVAVVRAGGERVAAPAADAAPQSVAASPDGRIVAVGLTDGTILLVDAADGREVSRLHGGADAVTALAYAPDGMLAWANLDGTVRTARREPEESAVVALHGHAAPVTALAVSPDGARIASGDADGIVLLWNTDRRSGPAATIEGHVAAVLSVAFSDDGGALWTTGLDRIVRKWRLPAGRAEWRRVTELPVAGTRVAALPDGGAVVGTGDGAVHVVAPDGSRETPCGRRGGGPVVSLSRAAVRGGEAMAVGLASSVVDVLRLPLARAGGPGAGPCAAGTTAVDIGDALRAFAVAPDGGAAYAAGRWVTAVGLDGSGPRWRLFVGPGGSVAVLPDGRHVCAGSCDDLVGFSEGAVLLRASDPAVAALRLDSGRGPGPR